MTTLAPLSIPVGYDFEQSLTVTDNDGDAIDLTGSTVTFHVWAFGSSDDTIDPAPTLTLVTPASGIARLTLTDTQTATLTPRTTYRYGVRILDATGLYTPPVYGLVYAADIPGAP